MHYSVEKNYCNCHPETCCCNPYKIVDTNGEKFETFYTKEKAQIVANALNSSKEIK